VALTMVHLLVADLWAINHPEFAENGEFFLGVVSPDAIHVRDHDDKSRKDEFHLYNWRSFHRQPVLDYWRNHQTAFDVGYGVHVLSDCQWVERYKARLPGLIKPDGVLDTDTYYNDTFVTDFELYNESPRLQHILELFERAKAPEDHPLLTADEFDQWRRMIAQAYRGECPRHDPVRFIDRDYVTRYASDSIPLIEEVYAEAFNRP